MNSTYLLEQLINGICQGAIYALVAIGYTMIVGVVGLVSLCYGETVMVGAFVSYLAFSLLGTSIPLAFAVSFIGTAVLGAVLHMFATELFRVTTAHLCDVLLVPHFLKNVVQLITKSETKAVPRILVQAILPLKTFG